MVLVCCKPFNHWPVIYTGTGYPEVYRYQYFALIFKRTSPKNLKILDSNPRKKVLNWNLHKIYSYRYFNRIRSDWPQIYRTVLYYSHIGTDTGYSLRYFTCRNVKMPMVYKCRLYLTGTGICNFFIRKLRFWGRFFEKIIPVPLLALCLVSHLIQKGG